MQPRTMYLLAALTVSMFLFFTNSAQAMSGHPKPCTGELVISPNNCEPPPDKCKRQVGGYGNCRPEYHPVPVPATLALLSTGLGLLMWTRRKK